MKQTTAPQPTPSPNETEPRTSGGSSTSINNLFIGMALDMSWRLAMSILVPIIGGVYLDKLAKTSPVFLLIGFALAIAGTVLVIRRTMRLADNNPVLQGSNKESDV